MKLAKKEKEFFNDCCNLTAKEIASKYLKYKITFDSVLDPENKNTYRKIVGYDQESLIVESDEGMGWSEVEANDVILVKCNYYYYVNLNEIEKVKFPLTVDVKAS